MRLFSSLSLSFWWSFLRFFLCFCFVGVFNAQAMYLISESNYLSVRQTAISAGILKRMASKVKQPESKVVSLQSLNGSPKLIAEAVREAKKICSNNGIDQTLVPIESEIQVASQPDGSYLFAHLECVVPTNGAVNAKGSTESCLRPGLVPSAGIVPVWNIAQKEEQDETDASTRAAAKAVAEMRATMHLDQSQLSDLRSFWDNSTVPVQAMSAQKVGEKTFYFSKLLEPPMEGDNLLTVMYVKNKNGVFLPRLVYRSRSDGVWRITPEIYGTSRYSKGNGIHYTQETKLNPALTQHLDSQVVQLTKIDEKQRKFIESYFSSTRQKSMDEQNVHNKRDTYVEEVKVFDDHGILKVLQACAPSTCFACKIQHGLGVLGGCPALEEELDKREDLRINSFTDYIEKLVNPSLQNSELAGFVPDFTQKPIRQKKVVYTLLSAHDEKGNPVPDVELKVFKGSLSGRPVEWTMAKDNRGNGWIEEIRFADADPTPTSYGGNPQIINSGILTNKPLEYREQARQLGLDEGDRSFDSYNYMDIRPLLQHLLPVKQFLAAESTRGE